MTKKLITAVAAISFAIPAMAITIEGEPYVIDYDAINAQINHDVNNGIAQQHQQFVQEQQQIHQQQQINAIVNGAIAAAHQHGYKDAAITVDIPGNDPLDQWVQEIHQQQQIQQQQQQINAIINGAIQNAIHAGYIHRTAEIDSLPALVSANKAKADAASGMSLEDYNAILEQMHQQQQIQQQQQFINGVIAGAIQNAQSHMPKKSADDQDLQSFIDQMNQYNQQQQQIQQQQQFINGVIAGAVQNAQNHMHGKAITTDPSNPDVIIITSDEDAQAAQIIADIQFQQQQQQIQQQINASVNAAIAAAQHYQATHH